jgi:murein L,D-transpeptidase YcbB/YkuD
MISLLFVFSAGQAAKKISINKSSVFILADSTLSAEIERQLVSNELSLYYPNSVKTFYQKRNFNSPWIKPQSGTGSTWQAMLLIDCVLQFGLSRDDYHPHELNYDDLHNILEKPGTITIKRQARFDIILTDALLNFINNLHFGKLNPDYPAKKIDSLTTGFRAEKALTDAIMEKDFMNAIGDVQPKSKEYTEMQHHMRLWTGLYTGDCYEIPESDIRLLAINMERLRWANVDSGSYIMVNIPSYTLTLYEADSTYEFKAIVGTSENPTPTLGSQISYFTTAPEWKVRNKIFRKELLPRALEDSSFLGNNHYAIYDGKGEYIEPNAANLSLVKQNPRKYRVTRSAGCDKAFGLVVFRFPNIYDVYLHDTPERQLFKKQQRDLSHGCVRVEYAEKLAALLLKYDGSGNKIAALDKAILKYQTKNFTLQKPVPLKIAYITSIVSKGEVLNYKDIYKLDNSLEMVLYNQTQQFTNR